MKRLSIILSIVLMTVWVGSVTINASQDVPPGIQAEFYSAAKSMPEFRVESAAEYQRIKEYRQSLITDGDIVHSFETRDGDECHCIDVYTQGALAAAGLGPEDVMFAPAVLPVEGPEQKRPDEVHHADGLRLDGSSDSKGRIRACPEKSFPRIIPSMEDLCRYRKLEDRFSKYPPAYLFEKTQKTSESQSASQTIQSDAAQSPDSGPGPLIGTNGNTGFNPAPVTHKYATVFRSQSNIGSGGDFNLWSPSVERDGEFSLCQLWCANGNGNDQQTVEMGWQSYKNLYGDNYPHLFIYYTTNNYTQDGDNLGCYNLDCQGFVQVDNTVPIGATWNSFSTEGGTQYYATFEAYRDTSTGHWWIRYGGTIWVGYYPNSLFDAQGLQNQSSIVNFGGEIADASAGGNTKTDMGSGKFPSRGFGYAAWVSMLHYWTPASYQHATGMGEHRTDANLYDVKYYSTTTDGWYNYIYYGGPGANQTNAELELYYDNFEDTDCFSAGDIFDGHYRISNGTSSVANIDLYILLEYYGNYAFWPTWGRAIDKQLVNVPASGVLDNSFLQFFWPGETGTISGIKFFGVMMEPDTYNRIGDIVELNLCALGSGDISFQLNWTYSGSGEGPDLDLHVTNPNGYHIYYGNPSSPDGGSLDADDLGACGVGNGGGPENIFWENGRAPNGAYSYAVNWYASCGYSSANFEIIVRVNGLEVDRKTGSISGGSQTFTYIY